MLGVREKQRNFDYGLKDQMTRVAVSIASNIVEGAERDLILYVDFQVPTGHYDHDLKENDYDPKDYKHS